MSHFYVSGPLRTCGPLLWSEEAITARWPAVSGDTPCVRVPPALTVIAEVDNFMQHHLVHLDMLADELTGHVTGAVGYSPFTKRLFFWTWGNAE